MNESMFAGSGSEYGSGVLITDELNQRPCRPPNLEAEVQILRALAQQLTRPPQVILKYLVEAAVDLCQAGTAGVSLIETLPNGEVVFRWVALAGVYEPYEGRTTDREHSPCGVCLSRNAPQLYHHSEHYFACLEPAEPPIVEGLVVPLLLEGQALGTIWIASHNEQRQFDGEDVRIMTSLGDFTAAALQSSRLRHAAEEAHNELSQCTIKLTQINQDLELALEELSITKEELRVRHEQLAVSQQVIKVERQRYQDLFDLAPDGYFVTDVHGAIQEANHVAITLLGLQDPSPVGIPLRHYVAEQDRQTYVRHQIQLRDAERVQFFELDLQSRQGRCFPAAISVMAIRSTEGQNIGLRWMVRDITDFKHVVAALQQSEELKQQILESSNDCIKVLTVDGQLLYVNTAGCHLFELDDSTSLLNVDWLSFWHGEDQECAKGAIAAAKAGNVGQFQGYCPTSKGNPKWWDVVVTPIRDASGQITQLLSISRDVTKQKQVEVERQQAELALREAHVQLESALVAGAVYTWRWDIPGDRMIVNVAVAHLFAVDPVVATTDGLPVASFVRAIHEDDRSQVSTAIEQAIKTGDKYATEYRVRTASGEERWLTARGQVEYDPIGNPVSFPGALIDITETKRTEAKLRQLSAKIEQQLRQFDAVASSVPDFIYTFDLAGRFTYINQPLLNLWQKTFAESVGKDFFELDYPTELADRLQRQIQQVITTCQPLKDETPYTSAFGTKAYEYIFVPLFDANGTVIGVAGTTRDITERKRIEAEREQLLQREQAAREAAERANRIKDEFLAVLSHELRSPLNPILGWSGLLSKGRLDAEKTAHGLQAIERNAKLQVQLIEDLLDVSRIMAGKLKLNTVPVNLAATIRAALETVQLAASSKAIQVQTRLDLEVGPVRGDSARLQQIIWNLLANAIKFTPEGGQVEIELTRMGAQARIQVRDTGKGINPDFLPYVFEHFQQADSATTRKFGGLGLGLAIVHHLVELHGGTVQANSLGDEQGATFTVSLPLLSEVDQQRREPEGSPRLTPPSSPLAGLRILLVDDESDTRDVIAFMLEQSGAIVTAVPSAAEALQAFTRNRFDVLTSDIGMPEMDGYMLMRKIRTMPPEQGGEILAIALTAYAGELDQEQAISAGFQTHIAKPVGSEVLVQTIVSLVGNRSATNVASDIL